MSTTQYRGFTLSRHSEVIYGSSRVRGNKPRRTVWEVCGGPSLLGVRGVRTDLRSLKARIDRALDAAK